MAEMETKKYRVTFGCFRHDGCGRVGREHGVEPQVLEVGSGTEQQEADALAEAVFRFAKPLLASSWFEVAVNMTDGKGSIEAGRFGEFTVEPADRALHPGRGR